MSSEKVVAYKGWKNFSFAEKRDRENKIQKGFAFLRLNTTNISFWLEKRRLILFSISAAPAPETSATSAAATTAAAAGA